MRRWSLVSSVSSGYTTGTTDSPGSLSVSLHLHAHHYKTLVTTTRIHMYIPFFSLQSYPSQEQISQDEQQQQHSGGVSRGDGQALEVPPSSYPSYIKCTCPNRNLLTCGLPLPRIPLWNFVDSYLGFCI